MFWLVHMVFWKLRHFLKVWISAFLGNWEGLAIVGPNTNMAKMGWSWEAPATFKTCFPFTSHFIHGHSTLILYLFGPRTWVCHPWPLPGEREKPWLWLCWITWLFPQTGGCRSEVEECHLPHSHSDESELHSKRTGEREGPKRHGGPALFLFTSLFVSKDPERHLCILTGSLSTGESNSSKNKNIWSAWCLAGWFRFYRSCFQEWLIMNKNVVGHWSPHSRKLKTLHVTEETLAKRKWPTRKKRQKPAQKHQRDLGCIFILNCDTKEKDVSNRMFP